MPLEDDTLIRNGGQDGEAALLHEIDSLVVSGHHTTMSVLPPLVSRFFPISVAKKPAGEGDLVDELDLELFGILVALGPPIFFVDLVAQLPEHIVDRLPGLSLGCASTSAALRINALKRLEGNGCVVRPVARNGRLRTRRLTTVRDRDMNIPTFTDKLKHLFRLHTLDLDLAQMPAAESSAYHMSTSVTRDGLGCGALCEDGPRIRMNKV